MLRFIVAVAMIVIIIKLAEDNPQVASGIILALYLGFVLYSTNLADKQINDADRKLLKTSDGRKIYYGMIIAKDDEIENN